MGHCPTSRSPGNGGGIPQVAPPALPDDLVWDASGEHVSPRSAPVPGPGVETATRQVSRSPGDSGGIPRVAPPALPDDLVWDVSGEHVSLDQLQYPAWASRPPRDKFQDHQGIVAGSCGCHPPTVPDDLVRPRVVEWGTRAGGLPPGRRLWGPAIGGGRHWSAPGELTQGVVAGYWVETLSRTWWQSLMGSATSARVIEAASAAAV